MEHRYSLRDIVADLPRRTGSSLKLEMSETSLKVGLKPSDRYVWPDLIVTAEVIDSPIILISAPGAMGKSMAAEAVAADLNAPFVDLSHLSVGSDTLTGLLARVLGWTQTPDLIKDLRSGRTALVLDGLDEAQLRAGRDHTIAFLRNIVGLVKDAEVSVGQVVIFGRRDAIETSYLVLTEHGISPFMATIAPLTQSQANELVDLELDNKVVSGQPHDAHRVHPIPFKELRDALFRQIAEALGAMIADEDDYWNSVEDFLGYPPVLLVLAERLAVKNPSADLADVQFRQNVHAHMQHGDLLRKIVEGILDRESRKVKDQLAQALSMNAADPKCSVLYTREEQLLRILNHSAEYLNLRVLPPGILSNGDRAVYEEQISTFVPDHPFLRGRKFANVVFGDYVRAFVAAGEQMGAHGRSKAEMLQACPLVGPFFAELVHSFLYEQSLRAGNSVRAVLAGEDLIDDLITSYYSGRIRGEAGFFYTHSPKQASLGLFGIASNREDGRIEQGLLFHVDNPSGVLELTTPLTQGVIVSQHGLVLKSLSDEVEIGPNLAIIVNELEIDGRRLTALGGRTSDAGELPGSILAVMKNVQHDPRLAVASYPASALRVSWPNAWHMWRPYLQPESEASEGIGNEHLQPKRWQLMIGIRRILTSFRGTINAPSANRDRIDQYATGSNPVFVAVLSGLVELGIIERSGSIYKLHLGVLGEYGVNYAAVRSANFVDTLSQLTSRLSEMEVVQTAFGEADG